MTCYFDHFILTKIINNYITDSFFILLIVVILYNIINFNIIPNKFQLIIEKIISHWELVVKENLNNNSNFYLWPLITLFFYILGINLMGFFLFTFPLTTHISLTFGLAFSIWIGVIILGVRNFKSLFLSNFMPSGAPLLLSPLLVIIEFVSNICRPIALGMRLAANLTAGHILLAILSDFSFKMLIYSYSLSNLFPIFIIIFMVVLEIGVLVIQAYVFCLLCVIYLKDSLELH